MLYAIKYSMKKKPTTLSGIQPSGRLHIGNYLGALKNFVALQNRYDGYFMIADLHSLTENYDLKEKTEFIYDLTAWYLAAGLDPQKSTIFLQSLVSEHSELAWILSCVTPLGELERMTQYKDKASRQKANINAGLLNYPILMAADILLYKTTTVPVGDDQTQHLEFARIIARKFNNRFGQTFPDPKPLLTPVARLMSLTDPTRKMSKSEPAGCLFLDDSPEVICEKIKKAVTATSPTQGEMSTGVKNLFLMLREFADQKTIKHFEAAEANGKIRYSELKDALAENIAKTLAPLQKKYHALKKDHTKLLAVLKSGSKKAQKTAATTLKEVKQKTGLLI